MTDGAGALGGCVHEWREPTVVAGTFKCSNCGALVPDPTLPSNVSDQHTAPEATEEPRPSSPNSAAGIVEFVFIDFDNDELLTHMLTHVRIRVYEDGSVQANLSIEQAKELLDHLTTWEQRRHKAGRAN